MLTVRVLLKMMASVMVIRWPAHVGRCCPTQNIDVFGYCACYPNIVQLGCRLIAWWFCWPRGEAAKFPRTTNKQADAGHVGPRHSPWGPSWAMHGMAHSKPAIGTRSVMWPILKGPLTWAKSGANHGAPYRSDTKELLKLNWAM